MQNRKFEEVNGKIPEKRNKVVIFKKQKPFVSELYDKDPNIKSICQVAITTAIASLLSIIVADSISAGRLHWKIIYYLDGLTWERLIGATLVDISLHLALFAVHPFFKIWLSLRSRHNPSANVLFIALYVFGIISSFVYVTMACSYFQLPKYLTVTLLVEQLRVCMKSYSFIRENAYKVLYPWHKDDTTGPAVWYAGQMSPTVGSFSQYCYFIFAPTLLYRDHYPRDQGSISWRTVLINFGMFAGGLTVALQVYTKIQVEDFHWTSLLHSFMASLPASMAMLSMATVSTMHGWMNMWAELMRFADRRYYEDWWCSKTHQEYYRKWNIIPYHFNHQYLYKDIKKAVKSPVFAMFIPILMSSLIHEYIIGFSMGFFLPVLTILFAGIGVLVIICKLKGTYIVLLSLFAGFYFMIWIYFIELNARNLCSREDSLFDIFYPRMIECYIKHNF